METSRNRDKTRRETGEPPSTSVRSVSVNEHTVRTVRRDVQADRAVDVDEPLGEETVPRVERGIVVAAQ